MAETALASSADIRWNPRAAARSPRAPLVFDMRAQSMMYVWVMLGGALGTGTRYWCSGYVAYHFGETFPWGTLVINVTGSFVIGFFATLTGPDGRFIASTPSRQFVMTGICGGYTTFSSFSLQTLNLVRDGEVAQAGANIGMSFVLCMIAVWLGHATAVYLNQLKGG